MPGRDNGFVARHYLPLADLDPRLAEAMLDILRAESIAAYVEPSTGHVGGYLEVHLPERPRDRLWVDRERRDQAAMLLSEHTAMPTPTLQAADPGATGSPGAGEPTIEDAWAQLVANYDMPSDDAVPRWPDAEDVPGAPWPLSDPHIDGQQALPIDGQPPAPAGPDTGPSTPVPRRIVRPAERNSTPFTQSVPAPSDPPLVSGEYDPLSILDEHFVPPTPPRPPALRPATKWAITAIVAGFALILVKAFTDAVPGSLALGVIGILGGFATLVAGMRQDRSDDSDSDDGAVV